MILIGVHPAVDAEKTVVYAADPEAVERTPAGSLVVMGFDETHLAFYKRAGIPLAVEVASVREYLLLMNTGAKYAVASTALAPALQKVAEEYLSDTKVLVELESDARLPWAAARGIDGVFIRR